MKRVVVDTNVLVSSALTPGGNSERIMASISAMQLQFYYSQEIMDEYKRVLAYEKLSLDSKTQEKITASLEERGILIKVTASDIPLSDETDRVFYDTAKASDAILITGNKRHFPIESFVKTPAEFLMDMKQNEE
jgi:putative PIN family toxin of toxin-antitoxin system